MTRVLAAVAVLAVALAACSGDDRDEGAAGTTTTTTALPTQLPDLVPAARQVLARGEPDRLEDRHLQLQACVHLGRAADAAAGAPPGDPIRGGLDDEGVRRLRAAADACPRDPAAAARELEGL